ncbi:hypothetical protein EU348_05040 [Chryseobacterium indologenes]|uniref:Right handed beta helix domain-containing protein n=1 Tax=Chryseobacterium indologenes TaxID=253 RepID=A0A411DJP3_CHRID|nr:hypothetical protein EU348_05040 [Chryseobacterium indologenes]
MKIQLFLIFFLSILCACQSSGFSYLPLPGGITGQYTKYYLPQNINTDKWDKLEIILPADYNKNRNRDFTEDVQTFFMVHKNIILPDYPVYISTGLKISSNSNILFQKNSKIIYTGKVEGRHDDIIKIENVENVNLYNAYVIGNRDAKLNHKGEWNAGISIQDARNIKVYNSTIKNTYGDGFFIGSETAQISENVIVDGGWIDNVRRDGVSINSAKNVTIKNLLISNTHGTLPETGLHIEPSMYENIMNDIFIDNIYTYNNANGGLGFNFLAFSLKGKPSKNITIDVNNFKSNLSNYSVGFSINTAHDLNNPYGKIIIRNSVFEKPKVGYIWRNEKEYKNLSISYENLINK